MDLHRVTSFLLEEGPIYVEPVQRCDPSLGSVRSTGEPVGWTWLQLGGLESPSRSPSRLHLCPAPLGEPHPDILSSRDALCLSQSSGRVRAWHHIEGIASSFLSA